MPQIDADHKTKIAEGASGANGTSEKLQNLL
jgi:hypothetical protein